MKTMKSCATKVEISYVLIGQYVDGLWHARMNWRSTGSAVDVAFDWSQVMTREEQKGDVVGFYHTHPLGMLSPSSRDDKTMLAWSNCFGKPLLCVISDGVETRAWSYDYKKERGTSVAKVVKLRGDWIVACD
jgi:proteasome lid subunit RPN8/RPN11